MIISTFQKLCLLLLSHCSLSIAHCLAKVLSIFFSSNSKKYRVAYKNLKICFPDKAEYWLKKTARESVNEYLKSLLESDVMQNELINQSLGTSIKNMRAGKEIKQLLIPVPPIEEQRKIVVKLEETQRKIKEYEKKIQELEVYKKQNTNSLFTN